VRVKRELRIPLLAVVIERILLDNRAGCAAGDTICETLEVTDRNDLLPSRVKQRAFPTLGSIAEAVKFVPAPFAFARTEGRVEELRDGPLGAIEVTGIEGDADPRIAEPDRGKRYARDYLDPIDPGDGLIGVPVPEGTRQPPVSGGLLESNHKASFQQIGKYLLVIIRFRP